MRKLAFSALTVVVAGLLFLSLENHRVGRQRVEHLSPVATPAVVTTARIAPGPSQHDGPKPPTADPVRRPVTKAERIEKINDDYDQLTLAVLGGLGADDKQNLGPSETFLRQLALLEHEKRRDLAAVLGPRELEDFELKETKAGKRVNRLLGDTAATEEQRRAVFRLQREFELQFDQAYDSSPRAYFEREYARQQTQEQIRAVLGEELFGTWLAGTDQLHATAVAGAREHGVSTRVANELRQANDDYSLSVLVLRATPDLTPEQRRDAKHQLAEEARADAIAILGPALDQTARAELLNWLPQE
jgi:hypothetical protein